MDRWMNRWMDELMNQGANFLRDAIWDHDWLKRWNLCSNVIAWIRAEFILEWVYTSLVLLLRHQDPDARPLFSVEILPREHTCCDTWSNGTSVPKKMESQELDFLSTWNNYKKKRQSMIFRHWTGSLRQWFLRQGNLCSEPYECPILLPPESSQAAAEEGRTMQETLMFSLNFFIHNLQGCPCEIQNRPLHMEGKTKIKERGRPLQIGRWQF